MKWARDPEAPEPEILRRKAMSVKQTGEKGSINVTLSFLNYCSY